MSATPQGLSRLHRTLTRHHRCRHHRIASELGLYYGQPVILLLLADHPQISQTELAERLHNTPASVAVSVKRMEKAGWLTKTPDPADARRNVLQLTDAGLALAHRCRTAWDAVDRQLYVGFTQEEMDVLADLFSRMDENLTRPEAEAKG